jgi:restriction system protein
MEKRIWVIHMRRLRFEASLQEQVNKGFVAIGWKLLDLRDLKSRDEIVHALDALGTVKAGAIPVYASQLFRFGYGMKKGDLIILPVAGSSVIKVGKVVDDFVSRNLDFDEDYVHLRKVQWIKDVQRSDYSQSAKHSIGSFSSISLGSDLVYDETMSLLEGKEVKKERDEELEKEEDPLLNLEDILAERLDDFISSRIDDNVGHQYAVIVAALLRAMDYVTEVAAAGPDGKRDIMAYPDELHLKDPMIRVEVKSSQYPISVDDVRALNGALRGNERGLFVARAGYTKTARDFAKDIPQLTLMDGEEVVRLLLKYYDKLDTETQSLIPLKQVWIPRV